MKKYEEAKEKTLEKLNLEKDKSELLKKKIIRLD